MYKSGRILRFFFYILFAILQSTSLSSEPDSSDKEANNSLSYNAGSTLLWGVGGTFVPLTYIFIPITYTRKINNAWSFAQFLLYRHEHYNSPTNSWHKFHELFVLPGARYSFSGEYEKGLYLSMHIGGGLGIGPNLNFTSLNVYPEIGYIFSNIYKDLYISLNLGFLYSYILSSSSPNHPAYSWSDNNIIGIMSHVLTPIGVASIGLKF